MLQDQYAKQIERLRKTFGGNKFPDEMIATMWHRLKSYSEQVFIDGVDTLVCDSKFPPRMGDIVTACNQARSRQPNPVAISTPSCSVCIGTGVIIGDRDANVHGWAFRCPRCDPRDLQGLPIWDDSLAQKFTIRMVG